MSKIKSEPVATAVLVLSLVLAALVTAGVITIDQVSGFAETVVKVLIILAPLPAGLWARARVTPTKEG